MKVLKRDGREKEFDIQRIYTAMQYAFKDVYLGNYDEEDLDKAKKAAYEYFNSLNYDIIIDIETIQDVVVDILKGIDNKVSIAYEEYREQRTLERERKSTLDTEIDNVINGISEESTANGNVDGSKIQSIRAIITNIVCRDYSRRHYIPKKYRKKHKKSLYIHDEYYFGLPFFNCIKDDSWIYFKDKNGIKYIQFKDLNSIFNLEENKVNFINEKCYVLGRNGWTRLKCIAFRKTDNDEINYTFNTSTGMRLTTTGKHKIPVIRNGVEELLYAKDIVKGDILLTSSGVSVSPSEHSNNYINLLDLDDEVLQLNISNLRKLKDYVKYKYSISLQELLKKHGYNVDMNLKTITAKQLKELMNDIEIPYDVIYELKCRAKASKTSLPIFISITESLAKLYGYIYADGGIYVNEGKSSHVLTFTNTNEQLIDDFINCFDDCFDFTPSKIYPSDTSNSPCIRSTVGSKIIVKIFKGFVNAHKDGANDISLPDFIVNGREEIKLAFLSSAIDCDGYLSNDIGYATVCKKYAEQIMKILKDLNYNPRLEIRKSKGSSYNINDVIGTRNYDTYIVKISQSKDIVDLSNKLSTFKFNQKFKEHEDKSSRDFIQSKITSISESTEQITVFDLTTESGWFITNDYVVHNCCVANWQNMFEGGFDLGTTHINTPKSLSTAVNVLTQVASHISSNTYGGTTFGSLVTGLCPYGIKSLNKWRVIGHKYIHDRDEAEQFAWEMFRKEAKDCAQSIEYEIQTLMTSRGETPFLTLGINVIDPNATPEEQEVQRIIATAILNQRLEGLTDGVTPVFPKLVFQLKEGNNLNPGDPNYDLFKLAVKTSARRSYPDYTMTEKVIEVTGSYKEPMGKKAA